MKKVELKKQDVTKKLLEDVAGEFNTLMNYETPIPTGKKVNKDPLMKDIIEASRDLRPADIPKLTPKTIEVLEALEIAMPVAEEKAEPDATEPDTPEGVNTDGDKTPNTPEKGAKSTQDKTKAKGKGEGHTKVRYTRAQAFCDALQGETKTMEEIAQKAMDLHVAANPGRKQPQLSSIEWAVRDYLQPLIILGFVEVKDKKYSLVK